MPVPLSEMRGTGLQREEEPKDRRGRASEERRSLGRAEEVEPAEPQVPRHRRVPRFRLRNSFGRLLSTTANRGHVSFRGR